MLWTLAVILFLFFLWIGAMNTVVIPLHWWLYKKHSSMVPLLGGLLGTVALIIVPLDGARFWWWVPLIVDLGSAPLMVATFIDWLRRRRSRE